MRRPAMLAASLVLRRPERRVGDPGKIMGRATTVKKKRER
jgi:hypothetical protein